MDYPITPDGRYFVVRGRLWRRTNPALEDGVRQQLTRELMAARRAVKGALHSADSEALRSARQAVDAAKVALGERGPVWWHDGSPDYNRRLVKNTPYADWYAALATPSVSAPVADTAITEDEHRHAPPPGPDPQA